MAFTSTEIGRTLIVIWGEVAVSDLEQLRVRLKDFGGRIGRLPVYLAITPPDAPAPSEEVRKEMLAMMAEVSSLTETLHLILEGKGLKFSALRSVVASMFLLGGNRRVFVHDTVGDALKKTSLDEKERRDVILTLGDRVP